MSDSPVLPAEVSQTLRTIVDEAGITQNTGLVERLLATGIGLGTDQAGKLDLKIASAALTEMRAAFALFAPFEQIPKATVFGSARTKPTDAAYQQTKCPFACRSRRSRTRRSPTAATWR